MVEEGTFWVVVIGLVIAICVTYSTNKRELEDLSNVFYQTLDMIGKGLVEVGDEMEKELSSIKERLPDYIPGEKGFISEVTKDIETDLDNISIKKARQ